MKKFLLATVALLFLFAATAAFAAEKEKQEKGEVATSLGSLNLYGVFKTGFNYYIGDETLGRAVDANGDDIGPQAKDRAQDMEFTINYFGFGMSGWVVSEHVTYNAGVVLRQKDLSVKDSDGATIGSAGSMSYIDVQDLKMGFLYIPYTGIYVGRFLPAFTYSNSIGNQYFKFIDEPLMNRYVATRGRQTGLNFNLVTPYIDANLGAYNGRQYFPTGPNGTGFIAANATAPVGNTTMGDQNTAKDIHFGVIGKPPLEGFKIRANLWYGMPLDGMEVKDGENTEHNVSVMFLDGGVDYLAPYGLTFVADVLWGKYTWDKKDPATNYEDDRGEGKAENYSLSTLAYYAMLGYNFGPAFNVPIEIIARYDWWDPDTLNDEKKVGHEMSEQDQLTDITAGVNYYIKNYNAMLTLNYVYHGEAWEKVLTKKGDDDQTGIANDELKLQAQVSF